MDETSKLQFLPLRRTPVARCGCGIVGIVIVHRLTQMDTEVTAKELTADDADEGRLST